MTNHTARINFEAKPAPSRVRVIGRSLSIAPYTCIKCQTTTDLPTVLVSTTGGPLCDGCYEKITDSCARRSATA